MKRLHVVVNNTHSFSTLCGKCSSDLSPFLTGTVKSGAYVSIIEEDGGSCCVCGSVEDQQSVAQSVEFLVWGQGVGGSSPSALTVFR